MSENDASIREESEIREKLEQIDKWRGDPSERERCCFPVDRGKIQALCWVLGMSIEEWDEEGRTNRND